MTFRREDLAEGVTLYQGDCREVLPTLRDYSVVLTDPPYGMAYKSGHATDALWSAGRTITGDESTGVRDEVLSVWCGQSVPRVVFGTRKVAVPAETRMVLVWDKGPALGMGALDLPWKPSSEEIYILGSGYVGARDESNVVYCPPVQSMAKNGRSHPNEKPVQLIKRLLVKCPGGSVLDPFMGSGSTGVAAVESGRGFIGIEIEPIYFDVACRRIAASLMQPDLLVDKPAPAKQEAFNV